MKEVHQLTLDEYESKISTYVQDIIPVEETDANKTEEFQTKAQKNLHTTLQKSVTQNYITASNSTTDKNNTIPKRTQKEKSVSTTIMTPPTSPTTPKHVKK